MLRLVEHNVVDTVLLQNVGKPAALFVFPTNVAAGRWADHTLRLLQQARLQQKAKLPNSGTVALDKFIAWDTFKQNSIRSKVKNRQSIPAVLREMFISALIRENAQACAKGELPVFSSLIRAEWAQEADSSAAWLTQILPQLGAWFKQTIGMPVAQIGEAEAMQAAKKLFNGEPSEDVSCDDGDLVTLALRYSQFMDTHGLFEPAWETPPFEDTGKECFIFFSESLTDFSEYKELLEKTDHVKIVYTNNVNINVNDTNMVNTINIKNNKNVFFYDNSRSEITEAALYILALHKNQDIPWDSISVSIPDDEYYGPYVLREFANRNIPCINLSGKPLASYPAGQFFSALAGCASADFSFAAVKDLLLNQHLPWKDSGTIQDLIEFGIKNNCISSWSEEEDGKQIPINVWEDAFTRPFGGIAAETRQFFNDLKTKAGAICRAGSFAEIRKHYFAFRERFFDMEDCLEETDLILSRCISELAYLIEIESSYPDVAVPNHYAFFAGYLADVNYLAQQSVSGVAILPYRTAAPAPFDCHIILGASQNCLSAVFSPLSFLPKNKREKLGITDNDASLAFIKLHQFNSRLPAAFFCSEQTFTGYAIPHSALDAPSKPRQRCGDDPQFSGQFAPDLYREESNFYARQSGSLQFDAQQQTENLPQEIHLSQKRGFEEWQLRRNHAAGKNTNGELAPNHPLMQQIRRRFCNDETLANKFRVSKSSLEPYFQCPLLWILSNVFHLENVEIETGLMPGTITGEIYHAVLNLFLEELKKTGKPIAMPINSGTDKKPDLRLPDLYSDMLAKKVDAVFSAFPRLLTSGSEPNNGKQAMSMMTARLLRAEKQLFFSRLETLLAEFCFCFAGSKVLATEENYSLEKDTYFLNGKIDCILEHDTLAIIDFKTKYTKIKDSVDFQLPLYLRLAEEKYQKDVRTALFFSIIDAKSFVLFGTEQEKKEIMDQFDAQAAQFIQEVSNGAFSFFPSHSEQCYECGHNKVCRTLYKVYPVCQGKDDGSR